MGIRRIESAPVFADPSCCDPSRLGLVGVPFGGAGALRGTLAARHVSLMVRRRTARGRALTALRFLTRSLSLRGSSFLLALLAITVGATVTATMLNIKIDLRAKMTRDLRRYGPNLLVVPALEARPGASSATLEEASVRGLPGLLGLGQVGRGAGLDAVSPLLFASGVVRPAPRSAVRPAPAGAGGAASAGSSVAPDFVDLAAIHEMQSAGSAATIVGADFKALRSLDSSWRIEGSWPEEGASPSGLVPCLAGAALARRLGVSEGRHLQILVGSHSLSAVITGILSTGEAQDEEIVLALERLQEATGHVGRVSLAALSIDGGSAAVSQAAAAIEAALPGVSARPLRQIAAAQGAILSKLERMMVLLTTAVLALSGLCLVTTLMAIVVEREREIGLMRSIGAGDGQILGMFVGEVGLLSLIGSLAGLALGAAAARLIGARLFGAPIEPRFEVAPWVLSISLALCLVSILVPIRRALAVQPAVALRGE